jgi:UDP-2-acetamido-3-amino-2,3-dideoxy-glucuronate N-acetyltransferase
MTPDGSPSEPWVHPTATIDAGATIGEGAHIWHHVHVMAGARIGRGVMLGHGCFIGRGVTIGDRTRIQNHVSVFEGVELDEDVFIGPGVVFTNVLRPRAFLKQNYERTFVRRGATIGAHATILPGIEIGEYAFVGAATLVRKNVPAHALVVGNPGEIIGWVDVRGERVRVAGETADAKPSGEHSPAIPEGRSRGAQ